MRLSEKLFERNEEDVQLIQNILEEMKALCLSLREKVLEDVSSVDSDEVILMVLMLLWLILGKGVGVRNLSLIFPPFLFFFLVMRKLLEKALKGDRQKVVEMLAGLVKEGLMELGEEDGLKVAMLHIGETLLELMEAELKNEEYLPKFLKKLQDLNFFLMEVE